MIKKSKNTREIYISARELEFMAKWARENGNYVKITYEPTDIWHNLEVQAMPNGKIEELPLFNEDLERL
jgi:hypothetical protein